MTYIYVMKKSSDILDTAQVAAELGIGIRRVQALLNAGKFLGAQKFGRDWAIPRSSLAGVKVYGKPGRPKSA